MFKTFHIALFERAVVFKDGLPILPLGPGRHTAWGFGLSAQTFDTRTLVFEAPDEVRAVLGEDSFAEARIGPRQRAMLFRRGRPTLFLRPGVTTYWTVDASVELVIYEIDQPMPELTDEFLAIVPKNEIVETTVLEYQRGLLYVSGRFERVLVPGRYALWTHAAAPIAIRLIDMRRKQLAVAGQELLTRDKVSLRLSLTLDYAPADPETAPHAIVDAETALYSLVQLAVREHVASVTLDELLEGRDALTRYLSTHTALEAMRFGIRVLAVGVKDIVLPGDMKTLLNRVIEVQKQVEANEILRRDEAASTRTLANAAKVMADNPVMLRMKELESFERIATNVGDVRVIVGADGLTKFLPALRAIKE